MLPIGQQQECLQISHWKSWKPGEIAQNFSSAKRKKPAIP